MISRKNLYVLVKASRNEEGFHFVIVLQQKQEKSLGDLYLIAVGPLAVEIGFIMAAPFVRGAAINYHKAKCYILVLVANLHRI